MATNSINNSMTDPNAISNFALVVEVLAKMAYEFLIYGVVPALVIVGCWFIWRMIVRLIVPRRRRRRRYYHHHPSSRYFG